MDKYDFTALKLMLGYILIIVIMVILSSCRCYSQVIVTEFNACWNRENSTPWLDSLQNCYLTKVEMDRFGKQKLQKKHNVTIIPTLIIFKDGKEVKRFLADISFTLKTKREEVQLIIDELNK